MTSHLVNLMINGSPEEIQVTGSMTLLQVLREKIGLTGTKNGCSAGECGACTVLIDGEPVNSCMILAVECNGSEITTIEGLSRDGQLDIIQRTIIEKGGIQCGFCTPGMLISARALLNRTPHPTQEQIQEALVGNLCRCTGYARIIHAVKVASESKSQGEYGVSTNQK